MALYTLFMSKLCTLYNITGGLYGRGGGGHCRFISVTAFAKKKHKKEVEVGNDPYTQRLVHVTSSS